MSVGTVHQILWLPGITSDVGGRGSAGSNLQLHTKGKIVNWMLLTGLGNSRFLGPLKGDVGTEPFIILYNKTIYKEIQPGFPECSISKTS